MYIADANVLVDVLSLSLEPPPYFGLSALYLTHELRTMDFCFFNVHTYI